MGVHSAAGLPCHGLRHEGGHHPVLHRDLFNQDPESHDVIGSGQGIGGAQIDFILPRSVFVMRKLYGNSHFFQHCHCSTAKRVISPVRHMVKIGSIVDRTQWLIQGSWWLQQVELNFGVNIESKTKIGGTL